MIEVVMAIVILAIALPPLINSFTDASLQTIKPANQAMAAFLATERMEEIVARRYRASDGYGAITVANYPTESPVGGFSMFTRTVTITCVDAAFNDVPCGPDPVYQKVRVTVTWNGGAGEIITERVIADF